ncbi:YdeI/OmpD-associated family protein [Kordia sp.]|uniref:YdeI/OmpD-associated family protein n=1 Tax=Kordia sp. TaxID=1965332 RepID=UPI003D6BE00D
MKKHKSVSAYVQSFPEWEDKLRTFQQIILKNPDVEETLKWNIPVYTVNEKNVVGFSAFKTHAGLWFYHGALLTDKANVLVNAQEGKTQAMRHWKFSASDTIPEDLVKKYIDEAVQNQKEGKTVTFKKKEAVEIPEELTAVFTSDSTVQEAFHKLTNYKQKEYIEHIATAKRAATKQSRLDKIIPMILEGKGLNDKYR